MSNTERTDYWTNRSGRSASRTRGKGGSPSRTKGRGKQADWRDRRDERYDRRDNRRDDRRDDRRGQSKERRGQSKDRRSTLDERPRQYKDLREYDNLDHPDVRQDLLDMAEDPNEPRHLTNPFLTQIWEGHRNPKAVTLTVWIQDYRGRGPEVRVNCRVYASSTWQRVPSEMLRYKKWTFIQQSEEDDWELIEADLGVQEYTAFPKKHNQFRMCVFMLRPSGKVFQANMAVDNEKCKKAN